VRRLAPLLLVAVAAALLAAGCGSSGSDDESAATTGTSAIATGTTSGGSEATASCTDVEVPAARKDGGAKQPTERLDPEKTYKLVFTTNCGSFTVTLDQKSAPATSASLVSLAKQGFYDNTIFHRIVPGFVIQGGDPTQTGSGGPGYKTVDAPAQDAAYVKGVVAMAKAADEAAGTSGSQFFIVTGDDVGLPPEYAIVGTVTEGLAVVEHIGTLGDASTEQPTRPVVIDSVTVEEQ
jgi:peptidyl-prolyl cis-trans isomerase B (cyclophilin B)